jgi:hypothetical protein
MKAKCTRNTRRNQQQGGGLGGGWGFSPEAAGTLINNPLAYKEIGNCRDATALRPGYIPNGYDSMRVHGGLPGMKGGSRKQKKQNKKNNKKNKQSRSRSRKNQTRRLRVQAGGRYGFDPEMATLLGGTPTTSGYAPVSSIACEASRSQIPDSGAANTLNSRTSYLWDSPATAGKQAGGGVGVSGNPISGAPFQEMPTAHYADNIAQPIRSAAGTNIMVHTPYNYSHMNQACLKTGGGKKKSVRKSKKSKSKSKKSKKHGRKH